MKHLLTGLLALFVFAPAVRAEVIDAVLFNPSRLGRYENLKVSSELDASGGVNVQTATVQSHSAVNVNSPSGYNLENVSAHKVNLPNTAFQSSSFQAAGGKASFGSGEIQNLKDSAQKMRVKGKTVTVGKDVTVEMLGGEDSSNQEVKGLRLGGNDIPQPVSGCVDLNWYAQKAASGKEYKVLGFKSCPGGEGECTKTCGAGYTLNEEKCECEKNSEETCEENPNQEKCCSGCSVWNGSVCKQKTCSSGYELNEKDCSCNKYIWVRNVGDDCTFSPSDPENTYDCMGKNPNVSPYWNIVSGGGGNCRPNSAACACLTLFGGTDVALPEGKCTKTDCGVCSASQVGYRGYAYATYSGLSMGATYTMGCVAYRCEMQQQ